MVSTVELKRKKELASAILANKNVKLNDWLEAQYDQVIMDNQQVVLEALNAYQTKNKRQMEVR